MQKTIIINRPIISNRALAVTGCAFLIAYMVSEIIKRTLMHLGTLDTKGLLGALQSSDTMMAYSTVAIVLQAIGVCAVPVFSYLITKAFVSCGTPPLYLLLTASAAVIIEIPYKLLFAKNIALNPLFAVVISLVMLYLLQKRGNKKILRLCIIFSALIWSLMLNIDSGILITLLCVVFYFCKNNNALCAITSSAALTLYSLYNIFYMFAPLCCILFFYCEKEKKYLQP